MHGWSVVVAAVRPDFSAVPAAGPLPQAVGALLTVTLITAVAVLVVCAAVAALAAAAGHPRVAARARAGVWVAVATAALAGGVIAWANFLLGVGAST